MSLKISIYLASHFLANNIDNIIVYLYIYLASSVSPPDARSLDQGKTNSKFAKITAITIDMMLWIGLSERALHLIMKSTR